MASLPGVAAHRLNPRHREVALLDCLLKQQYLWLARPKPAPIAAIDRRGLAYLST
jgi:hypothetical protein